jgi:hypothetical protein
MRKALFVGAACFLLGTTLLALAQSTGLRPDQFIALPWTWTGAQSFAEVQGTTYAPTFTSNNYNAVTGDCGKVLLLPTGTTPTVTLPNINPGTAGCVITFVQYSAVQDTFQAASGGTMDTNVNSYTKTKGTNAIVNLILTVPSVSAAHWLLSGDGA